MMPDLMGNNLNCAPLSACHPVDPADKSNIDHKNFAAICYTSKGIVFLLCNEDIEVHVERQCSHDPIDDIGDTR